MTDEILAERIYECVQLWKTYIKLDQSHMQRHDIQNICMQAGTWPNVVWTALQCSAVMMHIEY